MSKEASCTRPARLPAPWPGPLRRHLPACSARAAERCRGAQAAPVSWAELLAARAAWAARQEAEVAPQPPRRATQCMRCSP